MAMTRKTVIITGSVVIALLIGGSAYAFWPQISSIWNPGQSQEEKKQAEDSQKAAVEVQKNQATYNKALEAAQNEGPEAGQGVLDTALTTAGSDAEKAVIYQQKSSLASSGSQQPDTESAIEYAYEAEKLNPTYGSAILIATLEDRNNNSVDAIKYYKLYLERLDETAESQNPGDRQYYERRVAELEAAN